MSETKFTPKPWFRKGKRVYWQKPDKDLPRGTLPNGLICTCKSAEDWPECNEEARANAALIAAAPELYDALKESINDKCRKCINDTRRRGDKSYINPYDFIELGCPYNRTCVTSDYLKLLRKVRDGK